MVLFRQALDVIEIRKVIYPSFRLHHRPLHGDFQGIQAHLLRGRIEVVVSSFRFLISSIDEIPPGDLDGKHGEGPTIHVQDPSPVYLFEMRHQVLAGGDLPYIHPARHFGPRSRLRPQANLGNRTQES